MAKTTIDWREVLNWGEEQINELRLTGYAYIRQGKYEVARPFFEALTILEPDSIYDLQTLGAVYLQLGDVNKALSILNDALDLDDTHIPTLMNKAKGLLMLGYKEDGLRLSRQLQKYPDDNISNLASALLLAYG